MFSLTPFATLRARRLASAALVAALRLTRPFPILRQQPRQQAVRAEDDHEAAGDDHAAIGKCGHKSQALKPIV